MVNQAEPFDMLAWICI